MSDLTDVPWFDLYHELKRRGCAVLVFTPEELKGVDPELIADWFVPQIIEQIEFETGDR